MTTTLVPLYQARLVCVRSEQGKAGPVFVIHPYYSIEVADEPRAWD
jgi:hypothetical protein